MVKKSRINIGVGTPQRILDLLDDGESRARQDYLILTTAHQAAGALSTSHLERIIVDASHIDQKKRGILDMKETHLQLVQLLTREDLMKKYGKDEGEVELIIF